MWTDPYYELKIEPTDDPEKHKITCTMRISKELWDKWVSDIAKRTVVIKNVSKERE